MNLPFSPTFFRKMDIFQQLMEYESQKDKKHLWEGEKVSLIWAGSELHQHLGSPIDIHHLRNAFDYCVEKYFITEAEKGRLIGGSRHILESLVTHELAILYDYSNPKNPRIKINRNGILAGQILIETNNLKSTGKYKRWQWDWWFLYFGAGLLLALGVLNAAVQLLKTLFWK